MRCLRCSTEIQFAGTRKVRMGGNWGVFGGLGELFEGSEEFDIYICPHCGHSEFYYSTIGRDERPKE